MKLFNKTFFSSSFIITTLIILNTTKIEGMVSEDTQMGHEDTQMVDESTQTTEHYIFSPLFRPLRDLCDKYDATKCIDIESLQKAFSNIFELICTNIVRQNNPSQSILWLENLATREELAQLVEKLTKPLTHDASITVMAGSYTDSRSGKGYGYETNYYARTLEVLKTEAEHLYKKISMLIFMLNNAITTGQRPEYLNDAQLLQEEVIFQIENKEYQAQWDAWRDRWEKLQGIWTTVSGSCVIL